MYWDIGVVSFNPRHGYDDSEPYDLGDIVPIIMAISQNNAYDWHIYWIENTILGLKVGDAIGVDVMCNEMVELVRIFGLGVRVKDDILDKVKRRASVPVL